ncbi:hypothetical protein PHPALM_28820 [Phytophthora palmivora]|uniref:Uncharacterized protein n=1 Tax=Phytophthora palmivora TaxID=4796 RepID=A0A2P4X957_9STRA|nr:hypothetical protein PHPALM_28820 [Phytophthora palmivora]
MPNFIEEKGLAAGTITILESTIEKVLASYTARLRCQWIARQSTSTKLPESFEFPRTGPFRAWVIWWFGDKTHSYQPLREIRPHDLPKVSMGKQSSEWSKIIHHLRNAIESIGEEIADKMTERKATDIFQIAMNNLELTSSERKRQLAELSLTAVLRMTRGCLCTSR